MNQESSHRLADKSNSDLQGKGKNCLVESNDNRLASRNDMANGMSFEDAILRLEVIAKQLEEGSLELEQSIKIYAEGMNLVDFCTKAIDSAKNRANSLASEKSVHRDIHPDLPESSASSPSSASSASSSSFKSSGDSVPISVPASFDDAMKELETIVRNIESKSTTLENTLSMYERGTYLKNYCVEKLNSSKLVINEITSKGDDYMLSPVDDNSL